MESGGAEKGDWQRLRCGKPRHRDAGTAGIGFIVALAFIDYGLHVCAFSKVIRAPPSLRGLCHSPRATSAFRTETWLQPAWQNQTTVPPALTSIARLGRSSGCAGQWLTPRSPPRVHAQLG